MLLNTQEWPILSIITLSFSLSHNLGFEEYSQVIDIRELLTKVSIENEKAVKNKH